MNKKQLKSASKKSSIKAVSVKGKKDDIKSDVQGSYTGVPENKYERPVQDADDL